MSRFYMIFVILFLSCGDQNNKEKIKPSLSNITESVYASVTIKPKDVYFPQSTRSGIIQAIFVEEGEEVKKGQVLFQITPTAEVNNKLTTAELNLKEAKANYLGKDNMLINIEQEMALAKQQLAQDSVNYKRYENLWKEDAVKRIDFENAELAYQATLNKYNILKKKYAQALTNLENIYKKALNNVKSERSQLSDYSVRSKITGKIYSIRKEEGELIGPQEQFAEIGSADNFIIEMDIDEVDITKINSGDTVIIDLEAYPNEVFTAEISQIFPKKNETTQTFRVESVFKKKPPKLYFGLSGEANIIVDKRNNVLTIPSDYLRQGNMVLTADGEKEVKAGMKNMEFTEILSGIDTSTVLIKPTQ